MSIKKFGKSKHIEKGRTPAGKDYPVTDGIMSHSKQQTMLTTKACL